MRKCERQSLVEAWCAVYGCQARSRVVAGAGGDGFVGPRAHEERRGGTTRILANRVDYTLQISFPPKGRRFS